MRNNRPVDQGRLLAGRYRLGRVLGSGGAGIVREGEDTLLRRPVAIKQVRLPPPAVDGDGSGTRERDITRERVLREARVAARLRHPGLVAVYDVIEADDSPWIVMELVEGRSLAEIIRESGRLAPAVVARLGVSLAYALEAAHRGGVVHRDVKPGNILVTEDGQPRLTDFGIAVSEGDPALTSTGMVVGSPAYIPPERARGARVAAPGDVWGLGATLFSAVEGEPPYAGEGALATLAAIVEDRRRPCEHAGPLRPVLDELLDPDPGRRPSLARTRALLRQIAGSDPHPTNLLDAPGPGDEDPEPIREPVPTHTPGSGSGSGSGPGTGTGAGPEAGVRAGTRPATAGTAAASATPTATPTGTASAAASAAAGAGPGGPSGPGRMSGPPSAGSRSSGAGASPGAAARRRNPRLVVLAVIVVIALIGGLVGLGLVLTDGPAGTAGARATPGATGPAASASTPASTGLAGSPPGASADSSASTAPPAAPSAAADGGGAADLDELGIAIPSTTEPAPAPAGLRTQRGTAGWSVAVPADWRHAAPSATREIFTAAGGYPELLVETRAVAGPSAIAAWEELEADVRESSPGYRRLSIRPTDGGAGTTAAIWEFTSVSRGQTVRTLDFGVVRNGHGYALRWRVPEAQWQANQEVLRQIIASFRPGP
ncbi:serine/threonine protein kinase [Frankia sp. EI5c]|uniref:serine/threonine-protein kinase n=1 Tax=Frankia sp. EI5c TaxID=683316 RepID=UPI0007C3DB3C|nr:serine/threonine-protein kinase [Frankia sp. EI5c]OAA29063.1 serine/threonine protein kinase [Frankia sp. EI5c]